MSRINKLLVANRGEIASRVMRTARELDIGTVAVFSDADAHAPFVAEADQSVHLPGVAPADTYLRADLLLDAARRTGADAVHPGYGFLSENAGFARACEDAGLVFVGPPPAAIEAMGSKTAAKELMAHAGVPVLPGIVIDDEEVDPRSLEAQVAAEIGYPVLVKAAYGGGGRGMRVVEAKAGLADAVTSARREAASAFGNATVFLERYVDSPRHIEVQIFGDRHGTVVDLFERECSIQRRYQKILEEAPSPAVDDRLRAELGQAAVAAGKAIGYVGAGTVEFVLDSSGQFYFLEVNTRLQVEHPVTELVTGLDLVRLQLLVAEGAPLPQEALEATISGHAVEARLYAEDTAAGFLPATGTLHRFDIPRLPGVRVDAGVADGSVVSPHYDPMLAKVIAHGRTRDEAIRTLARTLADSRLHGVVTNRDLLIGILREDEFRSGAIDTGYLSRHDPVEVERCWRDPQAVSTHALAAALAGQAERRARARALATVPSGWRNVDNGPQRVAFVADGEDIDVTYRIRDGEVTGSVAGQALGAVHAFTLAPDRVDIAVGGTRCAMSVSRYGDEAYVDSALESTRLTEKARFPDPTAVREPGSLLAPMPGTVVRVAVELGQEVTAGTPILVLEAMKMEHTVAAPHDGTVASVNVAMGQAVDTGSVLAVVEERMD
ncbi:biotin carboxylase N-terminal domain-containing protein [Amycolatopsis tucumanensis]|uniref:Biotin carboxylase N-terminal domain-containing protein n=1 Tax=Amycolatopsis tucumanensis TaxID=401106 RepID=A0ABP7JS91_9PSEU